MHYSGNIGSVYEGAVMIPEKAFSSLVTVDCCQVDVYMYVCVIHSKDLP